jgi:excisionase family DNA binding protein
MPKYDRTSLLKDLSSDSPAAVKKLLRTSDIALLFQVSERTVAEWARRGRIPSVRTPGGHRRYPSEQIVKLLRDAEMAGENASE